MKMIICSIFVLCLTEILLAQNTSKVDNDQVFTKVEQEAEFVGGDTAWRSYIIHNLNASIPTNNNAPQGYYTIVIRFIVNKDSTVRNVGALTNFGYGMETEAVRFIKQGPHWIPARQNGRPVNAFKTIEIPFVVQQKE
jgi:protein TonB